MLFYSTYVENVLEARRKIPRGFYRSLTTDAVLTRSYPLWFVTRGAILGPRSLIFDILALEAFQKLKIAANESWRVESFSPANPG